MWREKHDRPIKAPYSNADIAAWRDDPKAIDSADFDPQALGYNKEKSR